MLRYHRWESAVRHLLVARRFANSLYMRPRHFAVTLLLTFGFAGCATPYQAKGLSGGHSDTQIDSNTVLVSFRGNAYTDREKVETYLLRRCAEVTLGDGYDFLVIIDKDSEAVHGSYSTAGTYSSNTSATVIGSGNMAFGQANTTGTFFPGQSIPYTKHRTEATIKMFKGKKPVEDSRAFDARELVHFLGGSNNVAP